MMNNDYSELTIVNIHCIVNLTIVSYQPNIHQLLVQLFYYFIMYLSYSELTLVTIFTVDTQLQ